MAYAASGLSLGWQLIGGKYSTWVYRSTDTFIGTIDQSAYFAAAGSIAGSPGMKLYDVVICEKTDSASIVWTYVSTLNTTTGDVTVTALAFAGAASFTTLATSGNSVLGDAAADLVGMHGTSASQRASSIQATSNLASSTDFGATQLAVVQEIMTTLTGKGIWKGAA